MCGTLQVLTLTSNNLFPQYQSQMTDFLNGCEVKVAAAVVIIIILGQARTMTGTSSDP